MSEPTSRELADWLAELRSMVRAHQLLWCLACYETSCTPACPLDGFIKRNATPGRDGGFVKLRWHFLLGLAVAVLQTVGCGQVTATDVNGLVTRGPAVDAGRQDEGGAPDGAADNNATGQDVGRPTDVDEGEHGTVSTPEASPPSCPPPCSRCADPLANLHPIACRPGCGTCSEAAGQIPVDACWGDGWFHCVHSCDECR